MAEEEKEEGLKWRTKEEKKQEERNDGRGEGRKVKVVILHNYDINKKPNLEWGSKNESFVQISQIKVTI